MHVVIERDINNALDQVNESFQLMIKNIGIIKAIQFIVNKVLL
jgi:ABC-type long-subunit fatty acid transport system fused permease/ATPase subunit